MSFGGVLRATAGYVHTLANNSEIWLHFFSEYGCNLFEVDVDFDVPRCSRGLTHGWSVCSHRRWPPTRINVGHSFFGQTEKIIVVITKLLVWCFAAFLCGNLS